jgi:penicillin-binding protein 1A
VTPAVRRTILATATAAAAAAALAAGFVAARPALEARLRRRIEEEARGRGVAVTVGDLRLSGTSVRLLEVVVEGAGGLRVLCREARVHPRLSWRGLLGRAATTDLAGAVVELPAGLRVALAPSRWVVESGRDLRLRHEARGEALELTVSRERGTTRALLHADNAHLSSLVEVRRHGCLVADLGTLDGQAQLVRGDAGLVRASWRLRSAGFALASLAAGAEACAAGTGEKTDVTGEGEVSALPAEGTLEVRRFHVSAAGVEARGRVLVAGPDAAHARIDLDVKVERFELGRVLAAAGLDLPASELGSALLALRVRGSLAEPLALAVEQRIDFEPPTRPVPQIERLKGPFVHRATGFDGRDVAIAVDPGSPDFVALDDVPPLLVRTLLLGEDANFFGHHGLDLAELPPAIATNLARGTFARGASTITQQLVKNLFLSRQKKLGRKLAEAALALLLDASLGKRRVLEIYLNVIEWGPGLYGLRPAARHYFDREPSALTPKQMAFLVAMIPGPVKYQRSIAGGVPTPFFDGLMASLLFKLHSTGDLDDAAFAAALVEPLGLAAEGPAASEGQDGAALTGSSPASSLPPTR